MHAGACVSTLCRTPTKAQCAGMPALCTSWVSAILTICLIFAGRATHRPLYLPSCGHFNDLFTYLWALHHSTEVVCTSVLANVCTMYAWRVLATLARIAFCHHCACTSAPTFYCAGKVGGPHGHVQPPSHALQPALGTCHHWEWPRVCKGIKSGSTSPECP